MIADAISIRPATADDAAGMTDLALQSKAVWGYSKDFMARCREELIVRDDDIRSGPIDYFVAVAPAGDLAGFCGLDKTSPDVHELDALFIDPRFMRRGIGEALFHHAKAHALKLGARRLIVESDPHAAGFYIALGGSRTGERSSGSIPGRSLPVLEFALCEPS